MTLPTQPNKQLYNGGSEWQNDYQDQPDWQQTFYRNYDQTIGRFLAVDPMAEATGDMSVYQYGNNNPVAFNDPLGDLSAAYGRILQQIEGADRYRGRESLGWADQTIANNWSYAMTYFGTHGMGGYSDRYGAQTVYSSKDTGTGSNGIHYTYGANGEIVSAMPNGLSKDSYGQQIDNYQTLDDGLGGQIIVDHRSEAMIIDIPNSFGKGSAFSTFVNELGQINSGIGAASVGLGTQNELIEFSVRTSFKSAQTWNEFRALRATQQSWRYANSLGKTGADFLKGTKILGAGLAIGSTAITATRAIMYYANGGTNSSVGIKAGLDIVMTGVGFLGQLVLVSVLLTFY